MIISEEYKTIVDQLSDKRALRALKKLISEEVELAINLMKKGVKEEYILGIWAQKFIKDGQIKMNLSTKGIRSMLELTLQSQDEIKKFLNEHKEYLSEKKTASNEFYCFYLSDTQKNRIRIHLLKNRNEEKKELLQ